jgi:hypothetical protein
MTLTTDLFVEERDAIHEHIGECLLAVGELRSSLLGEDFETAERLGTSFGDDLRLMEDLGWGCPPVGEAVKLTMPPEQLHRVFTRLRSEVEDRSQADARSKLITEACERVLGVVGRRPPPHLMGELATSPNGLRS